MKALVDCGAQANYILDNAAKVAGLPKWRKASLYLLYVANRSYMLG